jgi:hypothetical protein
MRLAPLHVVAPFAVTLRFGIVVVRNNPALICDQSSEDGIAEKVAAYIEEVLGMEGKNASR